MQHVSETSQLFAHHMTQVGPNTKPHLHVIESQIDIQPSGLLVSRVLKLSVLEQYWDVWCQHCEKLREHPNPAEML